MDRDRKEHDGVAADGAEDTENGTEDTPAGDENIFAGAEDMWEGDTDLPESADSMVLPKYPGDGENTDFPAETSDGVTGDTSPDTPPFTKDDGDLWGDDTDVREEIRGDAQGDAEAGTHAHRERKKKPGIEDITEEDYSGQPADGKRKNTDLYGQLCFWTAVVSLAIYALEPLISIYSLIVSILLSLIALGFYGSQKKRGMNTIAKVGEVMAYIALIGGILLLIAGIIYAAVT